MNNKYKCLVCEYEVPFKPYLNGIPSDEICPQCGLQFGLDDWGLSDSEREIFYKGYKVLVPSPIIFTYKILFNFIIYGFKIISAKL